MTWVLCPKAHQPWIQHLPDGAWVPMPDTTGPDEVSCSIPGFGGVCWQFDSAWVADPWVAYRSSCQDGAGAIFGTPAGPWLRPLPEPPQGGGLLACALLLAMLAARRRRG